MVVNGTTGESATLSDREKLAVIEAVIETVDGRVPVIAGTGSNCTRHAVELSKEAQRLGADALGLRVLAGPTEASTIGNMIQQGLATGTLESRDSAATGRDCLFCAARRDRMGCAICKGPTNLRMERH